MTEPADHMPEREALAAEYVLGTLPLPDRLAAEALIDSDPAFAALVLAWQNRLAPLDGEFAPVEPPAELYQRLERRLFPAKSHSPRRLGWLFGALSGLAVAVLAAIVLLPALPPIAPITATLTGEGQALTMSASYDSRAGELTVTRTGGPAAETGKDYELWVIPEGQAPISVGIVRDAALTVPLAALPPGATLAITLEAEGGSPTGAPQGPLLVAAIISEK
ncbi:MAG: anti-sigma factor [Rhodobacteraceae bacterium]|nr:anti-sigma factor [Paracoccaceae bacterium]